MQVALKVLLIFLSSFSYFLLAQDVLPSDHNEIDIETAVTVSPENCPVNCTCTPISQPCSSNCHSNWIWLYDSSMQCNPGFRLTDNAKCMKYEKEQKIECPLNDIKCCNIKFQKRPGNIVACSEQTYHLCGPICHRKNGTISRVEVMTELRRQNSQRWLRQRPAQLWQ